MGVFDDGGNDGGSLCICVRGRGDARVAGDTHTAARWHNHWGAGGRGRAKHEGAGSEAGSNL